MVIQGVSFNVLEVGKLVKKSKRRFTWNFLVDGDGYIVEMVASHISRKKRVFLNHEIIYEAKKMKERKESNSAFKFTFQIGVNICTIVQKGEQFDLRINNKTFQELCENRGTEFIFEPKQKAPARNQAETTQPPTQVASTVKEDKKLPAFSDTTIFKDELGDLSGLRGVRTKNLESANNTNSAIMKENKPSQANVVQTQPTQPVQPVVTQEKKPPTETGFFKQKNKEVPKIEPPPVQENNPAETNIAPPQTQTQSQAQIKAPKEQSAPKPTLKNKLGNVATGLKNAITGHKDNNDAEHPKPKSEHDKATPPNSGTLKEQQAPKVVHTLPTFADIMKDELGDLAGLRGVRTKKNPYSAENEASSAPKDNKSYNTQSNTKSKKKEVEETKEQVQTIHPTLPTSLVSVMKDELGDMSGIRGARKTIATEPAYTPHYTKPPVNDDYVEESTYARGSYSPAKQNYSSNQGYSSPQRYSPPKQEYREPQYNQSEYRQPEYNQQEYSQPQYNQPEYRQQEYREPAYQTYQQQPSYNTNISPQKPVVQKQQQQQQYANTNPFANPAAPTQTSSSTQNIFDQFGFNNNTPQQQSAPKQDSFASFNAFNAKPNNNTNFNNFGAQSVNNFGNAAPQFNQMASSIPAQTVTKQVAQNYPNQFNNQAPKTIPNPTQTFNAPPATNNNASENFDWDYSGFGKAGASQSTSNMGGFNNKGFNNANTGFNAAPNNFNAGFNNFNQNNFANNNRNFYQNNSQNLVQDLL